MKKLLILSGKGGTGKTTTAAALARFSNAQALADCDVDAPNLHIVTKMDAAPERSTFIGSQKAHIDREACTGCGKCVEHCRFRAILPEHGKFKINEYACEGCGVCSYVCPAQAVHLADDEAGEQLLYRGERVFSTAQLKMGRGNSGKLVTNVKIAMLRNAPETAELAIVDGSPGIGCPVIASVSGMDLVLVVAEPSMSGLSDLERLVKTTKTLDSRLAVCVNKWDTSPAGTESIERFCAENEVPFLGKIPYDSAASRAINEGCSIADIECSARDALWEIYQKVRELLEL